MECAEKNHLRVMLNTIVDVAPAWIYRKYPDASMLTLDGRHTDLQVGDSVVVSLGSEYRSYTITQIDEVQRATGPASSITINAAPKASRKQRSPWSGGCSDA